MVKAQFVEDVSGSFKGEAHLFKLSEPVEYKDWTADGAEPHEADYVVVSAVVAPYTGAETYIFPSDANGRPVNWGELPGSYRGGLSIRIAIENAGWEYVE